MHSFKSVLTYEYVDATTCTCINISLYVRALTKALFSPVLWEPWECRRDDTHIAFFTKAALFILLLIKDTLMDILQRKLKWPETQLEKHLTVCPQFFRTNEFLKLSMDRAFMSKLLRGLDCHYIDRFYFTMISTALSPVLRDLKVTEYYSRAYYLWDNKCEFCLFKVEVNYSWASNEIFL